MTLEFKLADQSTEATPQAVLHAWENGDNIAPLVGGGWAKLPEEWLTRHGPQVSD